MSCRRLNAHLSSPSDISYRPVPWHQDASGSLLTPPPGWLLRRKFVGIVREYLETHQNLMREYLTIAWVGRRREAKGDALKKVRKRRGYVLLCS
jgi:hypothetical protein